jgi:hypothetical protein
MKTHTKKVPFNIIRMMEKHLSKRGSVYPMKNYWMQSWN